ncbi:MAG TPA: hypothetical protein VHB46_03130 [Burkholderiales bacterium]|nr:hypothetical protein [Burkholderiales bacterium]
MKTRLLVALLSLIGSLAHAQTPVCSEWESKLKVDINEANGCEAEYQACVDLGPTNPMRELNYCRNLQATCESLDGPIESDEVKQQVEEYKKQCS